MVYAVGPTNETSTSIRTAVTGQQQKDYLIFLTVERPPNSSEMMPMPFEGNKLVVNLVTPSPNASYHLSMDQAGNIGMSPHPARPFLRHYELSGSKPASPKAAQDDSTDTSSSPMYLYRAELMGSGNGSGVEYSIEGLGARRPTMVRAPPGLATPSAPSNNTSGAGTDLTVCVFSDYRHDWMHRTRVNLSHYVEENECNLNLFIGRVVFEERQHSTVSFNPYVMLHSDGGSEMGPEHVSRHGAFAKVPSLFGGVGTEKQETRVFDSIELNGVAFIQYTIEVKTALTKFHPELGEQKLYDYFEELMATEIECKLKVGMALW